MVSVVARIERTEAGVIYDNITWMVELYFARLTRIPFEFGGQVFHPKMLRVAPNIFRTFTCQEGCGACCARNSLDWLPAERMPYAAQPRVVQFDGRSILVFSDFQTDLESTEDHVWCRNLRLDDGRCQVWGPYPIYCQFAFVHFNRMYGGTAANLTHRKPGRAWAMKTVGGRGAKCELSPHQKETIQDLLQRFARLQEWCDHFGLVTVVPDIVEWIKSGPHEEPLWLNTEYQPEAKAGDVSLTVL